MWRPWLRFGRKFKERLWGVKSLGRSRFAWYVFRQKVVWVTSENGDGRAEKPRYEVPQGVGDEMNETRRERKKNLEENNEKQKNP